MTHITFSFLHYKILYKIQDPHNQKPKGIVIYVVSIVSSGQECQCRTDVLETNTESSPSIQKVTKRLLEAQT